jgi:rRNA maturation endonuclease Nob1
MNVNDREWNGDCPNHKGVKLQSLNSPPDACPRCGGPLEILEKEIIKHEEEAAAT